MTQPDWDDDRVAEAFHARFDRPAPPTLARAIHGATVGTSPARPRAFGRFPVRNLAAAAVGVLLVGSVAVAFGDIGRLSGGPSLPSNPTAIATSSGDTASPAASPVEPPASILGLDVLSVSEALAIRDADADDREIAVQGWFTPPMLMSCGPAPTADPVSPVQPHCPDEITWLTEDAESLVHVSGNRMDVGSPHGPALNPDLDDIDSSWWPDLPTPGVDGDSTPANVVFIGHFDDRRAVLCPEAEVAVCRDRFVVDSVALVDGSLLPRSVMRYVPPTSSVVDIEAIIAEEAPLSPILSMVIIDGNDARLTELEPTLAGGQGRLIDRPVLWIVRVLESARAVTYIVVDGTDAIYEMNSDGEAIHVGGTTGDPVATPGPWPPDDAVIVALTSPVGAGEPPVQVAVVDQSGRLTGVTEKGAVDPSTMSFDGRFGAYAEPGTPGRVHLTWVGGICDSHVTVTVAADLGSITFDMGPPPANCDSIGVGRELVLDFDGTVDVPAIELRDVADAPAPVATSPAYQLDCGPLGPDTCERRTAALVAALLKASPTKRIESITFRGNEQCPSHMVFFDDGTGVGAYPTCVAPASPR